MSHITFNVSCLVGQKALLDDVVGEALPGEVLTIMSASGGGKTTLFDALYRESAPGIRFFGHVKVNGELMSSTIRRDIAYVQQAETAEPLLTPKEYLNDLAQLFLPEKVREHRVSELINLFGLTKCQNTLIGSAQTNPYGKAVRGLSGGERRRTYIAGELLRRPSIIFLDEPTSGLDSHIASAVFKYIRNLAKEHGCTVVMTVHQPSSAMFADFDKLLLLVRGQIVYFGEADKAKEFFQVPMHGYNPADVIIEELDRIDKGNETIADLLKRKAREQTDLEAAQKTEPGVVPIPVFDITVITPTTPAIPTTLQEDPRDMEMIREPAAPSNIKPKQQVLFVPDPRYVAPFWTQFHVLLKRYHKIGWRSFNPAAAALTVIFALIVGFIGVRGKHLTLTEERVIVTSAVLFLEFIYGGGFLPAIDTMTHCENGRRVIVKEYKAGAYGVIPLFMAKRVAEFVREQSLPMVFYWIVYILVLQRWDQYLLLHFAMMSLCTHISATMGWCYSGMSGGSIQVGYFYQAIISTLWLLTMGYYIPPAYMPKWFGWWEYAQSYRWCYDALRRIMYTGLTVHRDADSTFLNAANLARIGNATTYSSNILFNQIGVKYSLGQTFGIALGFVCFMNILALLIWKGCVLRK